MFLLWIFISIMIISALTFILLPLWRKKTELALSYDENIKLLYKSKLIDLEDHLQQKLLTPEQFALEKQDLLQNLLSDHKNNESKINLFSNKHKIIISLLITMIFPVLAIKLYFTWGDSAQLSQYYAMQDNLKLSKQELAQFKNPHELIAAMQKTLVLHPESAKGWYLLGRLYMSQSDFSKAMEAFKKANDLKPNDAATMMSYAESIYFQNNLLTPVAKQLINQVLKQMPGEPDAINLLAIDAYHRKDYHEAIKYWENLLDEFPEGSSENKALLKAIADAQKKSL